MVVEASGSPGGLETAAGVVESEGTIVLKSTYAGTPGFDFSLGVVVPEVRVVGSRCGPFDMALRMLREGRIRTGAMIEEEFPLENWPKAFAAARKPGVLKVLLRME